MALKGPTALSRQQEPTFGAALAGAADDEDALPDVESERGAEEVKEEEKDEEEDEDAEPSRAAEVIPTQTKADENKHAE